MAIVPPLQGVPRYTLRIPEALPRAFMLRPLRGDGNYSRFRGIKNGARLGWLIDPVDRRVDIYRPGQPPTTLEAPTQLNADPELPGFTLDLTTIW